jgi:competence protein ComEA
MGKLYDDSIFAKHEEATRQKEAASNRLFLIFIVLVVLIFAGIYVWRWWSARQPVDINRASIEQLQTLPQVGPVTAREIIAGRPYATPEDLKRVKGIGDQTFEKMRPRVKVE